MVGEKTRRKKSKMLKEELGEEPKVDAEIINFTVTQADDLDAALHFYNPWWTGDMPKYLTKEYKRDVYQKLESYLGLNRIMILKGPRRVGKTTLMYQLIEKLAKEIDSRRILYISFDDPKLKDFDAILEKYQTTILQNSLDSKPTYFFLDEVQYLKDWQYLLKKYYDRNYPIKFIASGSSATLIKQGTESLMGRTVEETILPFSFKEYMQYKLKRTVAIKPDADSIEIKKYEKDAKILLEEYVLKGGFPNIFDVREPELWEKLIKEDIIDKVIYKDITTQYDIKRPENLEKLFLYLTSINGQILNVSNIADSLQMSVEYTSKYIQYLKNSYLILEAGKYAASIEKTIRSSQKVYVIDPGIVNSLLSKTKTDEAGHTIESVIAIHLQRQGLKYYYWREYYEVDFVAETKDGPLPIEVKYRNHPAKNDLKGLIKFMEKYDCKKGIVVTKDLRQTIEMNGRKVECVPAWLYLLWENVKK